MNPLYIIFILLFLCFNGKSIGQNKIPKGKDINLNGHISDKEWNDASVFTLKEKGIVDCRVFIKHNQENLLIAYQYNNPKDSTYIFPEFFMDTKTDKNPQWQKDDYWFHISAQDCYAIGKREDYSNCMVESPQWKAVPNYPFGDEFKQINAFEISIPFEFINIKPGQNIGICFSIAIYPDEVRINYPDGSHEDKPSTWMELNID